MMRNLNQDKTPAVILPDIGRISPDSGMIARDSCSDGYFRVGRDGVVSVLATGDGKVEFIAFEDRTIAYVRSAMGHPAYYPVYPVRLIRPVKYVLMDLDGTTVRSERFWMRVIEQTTATLLGDENFSLEEEDFPYVTGHSVSEHLLYCIGKYCPGADISRARDLYYDHTRRELKRVLEEGGSGDFEATPGVREFLLKLKEQGIRIALVTSGLYEKAWPEIVSVFRDLDLGRPEEFYDAIITAGTQPGQGVPGTLGELEPKPHPWLYSEAATIGLRVKKEERDRVAGIDDSGAGICSIRLAGFTPVGIAGGNIRQSGTRELCAHYADTFDAIFEYLVGR